MTWIILSAVLPALVLVCFIYRKDRYRKEPARQLIKAFCFGCLSAPASLLLSTPLEALGLFSTEVLPVRGRWRHPGGGQRLY